MDRNICKLSDAVKMRRPVLRGILDRYGDMSIGEYASNFEHRTTERKTIQHSDDFINVCSEYIEELYGIAAVVKIKERLINRNDILTANHHGPTYCNIQVHGNIIYALGECPDSFLPSFAFGDVPLNNATYPRGINLSGRVKIPLFSDSKKNSLVSFVDSFTKKDVDKATKKTDLFFEQNKLSEKEYKAVKALLSIYSTEDVLLCSTYTDQSVIINRLLWKMFFDDKYDVCLPEMACFEIEKIVSELLKLDMDNKNSLIYRIFFENTLRSKLLQKLNGKYGCWDLNKLVQLLDCKDKNDKDQHNSRKSLIAGSGTSFFWGIDHKKRRIPLALKYISNELFLIGVSDSGEEYKLLFNSQTICDAINSEKLLPSLFTCFCVISFARGYTCYGGFMQADYLSDMRDGLSSALKKSGLTDWADIVSSQKTDNYCTGPHFILKRHLNNKLYPAGGIDLIANGGLTNKNIEFIKNISLRHAYYLSLPEIYPAVYRKIERENELEIITIDDVASDLGEDKFIVIDD